MNNYVLKLLKTPIVTVVSC